MKKTFLLLISVLLFGSSYAQDEARLLRFPAIHGNQVIFTYAGDLYTVNRDGGIARKLTNHDGYEMFAHFSPDGSKLAFTAQYDGNTEVFLMDAQGGSPKRLTYTATLGRDDISDRMGPNNIVMGWKNDNQIIYRSRKKSFNSFKGQLFLANTAGGLSEELPLPGGGFCSYSPDGSKLAYNRVFREFRTWKYYRGGMADDVWIYDFKSKETVNITNNEAQDIFPMWVGDNIYFLSDRDRTMNLFVYNNVSGETKKVTNYNNYDIKFPSLGDDAIIYENGGYLYIFDLATQQSKKIEVIIANDLLTSRNELKDVSKFIDSYAISPDGKRLTFGARGDIWSVPAKDGITYNLTESSGVHDRNVEWAPDGKYISYISDRTGEDEIYIQKQDRSEKAIQITSNSKNYKYNPIWSPDSKKLLWSDRMQRLRYINIDSRQVVEVLQTPEGEINDYSWSPDSRWIAYQMPTKEEMNRIYIYSLETKEAKAVTDGWYASGNPSFSSDGKYLFFTSARDFNPIYSWTEWNHAYRDMMKLYFVTLRKDVENPFKAVNDEVAVTEDKAETSGSESEADKAKKDEKSEPTSGTDSKNISIDFDGIVDRIIDIPGKAGFYFNINALDDKVYYVTGQSGAGRAKLLLYDLKKQKETEIGEYSNYLISADHKKMVINDMGKYAIVDLPSSATKLSEYVDLSNMKAWINLHEEWNQIFKEASRQMRDFFYDPNMHGLNWEAIRTKYEPLAAKVNNRNDLNYIIGEMIGELSVGHAYINGGDKPEPKRIKLGLLGAEFSRDKSGFYRIDKILKGENWTNDKRSPLTEVGINASEGNYIVAINGKSTANMKDIYEALVDKADVEIELSINENPSLEGARKVLIKPIADESKLYYFNWVQENIRKVTEATNGQVGYIHIPDMSAEGLNEFVKYYYPQLRKRALIIDDRGNGGGNVSPMIIERLRRELSLMRIARNGTPNTNPAGLNYGPKVMLLDKYSASDGDLFPFQFQTLKMGKLIGTRSWGGVVGIRGSLPFIDGGDLRKPEFSSYAKDGSKFVIEGHGVDPDIVVDNDPAKEYEGIDQQLNKAIEVILEELKDWPEGLPGAPAYPDKSK